MSDQNDNAVEEYRKIRPVYESFSLRIESLIKELLYNNGVKFHIVESRVKAIKSFEEKIIRPGKSYRDPINEITDLCGCRIIVHYQDEVETVCHILKEEFEVREENLSRQPELLDVDRFGYISAHYVIGIKENRSILSEWRAYSTLCAEVQVRTVIQHAWSAVSHAVDYKQEIGVPSKIQRRLYRIAGLFELADEEFVGIRKDQEQVRSRAREEILAGNVEVKLSVASIVEFLTTWNKFDMYTGQAKKAGFDVTSDIHSPRFIGLIYDTATLAGLNKVSDLDANIIDIPDDYFDKLIAAADNNWNASSTFIFALMLFYVSRKRLTPEFLIERGFDAQTSRMVMNVLRKYN